MRTKLLVLLLAMMVFPAHAMDFQHAQQNLAQIEAQLHQLDPPDWLPAPFGDVEAQAWVATSVDVKETAQAAIDKLQQIGASVELPLTRGTVQQGADYDRQDLARLQRLAENHIRRVDEAVQQTHANLRGMFEIQNRELEYFRNLDPNNPNHRSNAFLVEGAEERVYGQLDLHAARAESWAAWQRAFTPQITQATADRIAEIQNLRQRYAQQRLDMIGQSRLPEPSSTDSERLAIARQILAQPDYGFGRHGSVVLTSAEITDHEREVSRAEIRELDVSLSGDITLRGTETTWYYRWQEFRFATPIQDTATGNWYIWWITARNYSSGWERTPIGRWVSGAAVQGDQILEAHIFNNGESAKLWPLESAGPGFELAGLFMDRPTAPPPATANCPANCNERFRGGMCFCQPKEGKCPEGTEGRPQNVQPPLECSVHARRPGSSTSPVNRLAAFDLPQFSV